MNQNQENTNLSNYETQSNVPISSIQSVNNQNTNQGVINQSIVTQPNQTEVVGTNDNVINSSKENKKNIGLILGIVFTIIAIVILAIVLGIKFLLKNSDNTIVDNNNMSETFDSNKYSLIYKELNWKDKYWDEKNKYFDIMTNKEYFMGGYVKQVLNQNDTSLGGNLTMPMQDSYTLYHILIDGGGGTEKCVYYVKIDFNKDKIFLPNMISGDFTGTNENLYRFYILDSNMNFNSITPTFKHFMKTSKEDIPDSEMIYQKNNWEISKIVTGDGMRIYADYILSKEDSDFIQFEINIYGKLDDKQTSEFVNKFIENVDISIIDDNNIESYLTYISSAGGYVKLKSDLIKFSDNFSLKAKDLNLGLWSSTKSKLMVTYYSSTGNVNLFQWYDNNWKEGHDRILLSEYVDADLETVINGYFKNLEVQDYTYKNLKLKAAYDRDNSYRKEKGYSDLVTFIFAVDNNVYMVETREYLKENEVEQFTDYLFDNIFSIKQQ